jgi:hypothetical protein
MKVYRHGFDGHIECLLAREEKAYVLVNEMQENAHSYYITLLLKNNGGYRVTIQLECMGVPKYESALSSFMRNIDTSCLFLTDQDLGVSEGVIDYFVGEATATTSQIESLL